MSATLEPLTITPAMKAYRPYGAAESLMYCRDREVLLDGPRGTGKSVACLTKVYACAEKYPGMRAGIIRKVRKSLTDAALVTWERDVLPEGHPALDGAHREQRHTYRFPNGSEVIVRGLDDAQKQRSAEYDLVYIQEATELHPDDLSELNGSMRHWKMPFQQIIMDCNPDTPTHWLKRRFEAGTTTRFPSKHEDNPRLWDHDAGAWTPEGAEYIARLDAIPEKALRLRHRYGIWAGAEGAIYDCFDVDVDVIDPFDVNAEEYEYWPRYVGLDFGAVHTAAVFYLADPDSDELYAYREYLAGGRTAGQHVHWLRAGEPYLTRCVGGAKAEQQWRDEFTVAGLPVFAPKVSAVDIGISRVYGQHKRHAIKVFSTLTGYLEQKLDYRYRQDASVPDEIEGKHMYHFMDAERYIVSDLRPEPRSWRPATIGRLGVAVAPER